MKRRISPIVISLCTIIVGASASYAQIKDFNAITPDGVNALGVDEVAVPELQGLGGVALLTVLGSVAYGARKLYQKISGRDSQ